MNLKKYSLNLSEKDYRALPCLSYSALSTYDREGYSCVKTLFDPISTPSLLFGSMVDCYLTQGVQDFKDQYAYLEVELPSDSLVSIAKYIAEGSQASTLKEVEEDRIMEAADVFNYQSKWKPVTRIEKIKEGIKDYYEFIKANEGKTVVSKEMYDDVIKVCTALLEDELTGTYFNPHKQNKDWAYYNQLQFTSEEPLSKIQFKGMLDLVIVDEVNKIIYPCDLKTSKNVYEFEDSFYKYRYYIQAAMYTQLLKDTLAKEMIFDYKIAPYQFIVIDRDNCKPMIFEWETSDKVVDMYGKKRKNWKQLLTELDWTLAHKDEGLPFDWSMKTKNGKIILKNYAVINEFKN